MTCIHCYDSVPTASMMSLNQSIASVYFEKECDLLEKFGLKEFQPTELHIAALYGMCCIAGMYTMQPNAIIWISFVILCCTMICRSKTKFDCPC